MAEFAELSLEEVAETQDMDGKSVGTISLQGPTCWKVYVDGAANQRGSGVGLVLVSPKRITIEKSLRLGFSATLLSLFDTTPFGLEKYRIKFELFY